MESKEYGVIQFGREKIESYEKDLYHAGYFSDFGEEGDKIVLECPVKRQIFRKIKIRKNDLLIDACDGEEPLPIPKDTEIVYEPWFMDRGSYLFHNPPGNIHPSGQLLKIATEGDVLKDGRNIF